MNEQPVFLYKQVLSLIDLYRLTSYHFKVGSAQGFADHLYSSHLFPLDVEEIAKEIRRYMRQCRASEKLGRSYDAELARMRKALLKQAHETDAARAKVANIIQELVLSPEGLAPWNLIAQFATTPSTAYNEVLEGGELPARTIERVRETLTALLTVGRTLDDSCSGVNYAPGNSLEVDWMVRQDIERLHVTLATASPAHQRQPKGTYALHAVLRFARIVVGKTKSIVSEAGEMPPGQLGCAFTVHQPAAPANTP